MTFVVPINCVTLHNKQWRIKGKEFQSTLPCLESWDVTLRYKRIPQKFGDSQMCRLFRIEIMVDCPGGGSELWGEAAVLGSPFQSPPFPTCADIRHLLSLQENSTVEMKNTTSKYCPRKVLSGHLNGFLEEMKVNVINIHFPVNKNLKD